MIDVFGWLFTVVLFVLVLLPSVFLFFRRTEQNAQRTTFKNNRMRDYDPHREHWLHLGKGDTVVMLNAIHGTIFSMTCNTIDEYCEDGACPYLVVAYVDGEGSIASKGFTPNDAFYVLNLVLAGR